MAVELKFYTPDIIDLDEIDAGKVRMNYGTVIPVKIKNEGKDKAKNVIIASNTLNSLEELEEQYGDTALAEAEYKKQKLAASWKTFSLEEDGVYSESLELGNINAGEFLQGTQTIEETFTNKEKCVLQDVWSYCLENMSNNKLKIYKNEAKSQTAQRKDLNIGKRRDVQILFKMNYEREASAYNKSNCLVIFPVRINDKGVGYILSFQFRASDGKMYFGVYKDGKGMVSNLSRTYGTRFIDTGGFKAFDPNKLMGARVFNDENDNVCFQFMLNGEWQTLYNSKDNKQKGKVLSDPDNKYKEAGLAYFDVGMYYGDLSVTLSNFSVTTETDQQTVYIKSVIDTNAKDAENYMSAITLNYIEG